MTQDVVQMSSTVRWDGASHPRMCVTETTTAKTSPMNRTVVCICKKNFCCNLKLLLHYFCNGVTMATNDVAVKKYILINVGRRS